MGKPSTYLRRRHLIPRTSTASRLFLPRKKTNYVLRPGAQEAAAGAQTKGRSQAGQPSVTAVPPNRYYGSYYDLQ